MYQKKPSGSSDGAVGGHCLDQKLSQSQAFPGWSLAAALIIWTPPLHPSRSPCMQGCLSEELAEDGQQTAAVLVVDAHLPAIDKHSAIRAVHS